MLTVKKFLLLVGRTLVKKLFSVLLVATIPVFAHAFDITLSWDPHQDSDLQGYRIFYCEEGQPFDYEQPAWQGKDNTCTILNLDGTKSYCFVARAFNILDMESADSNMVCFPQIPLIETGELTVTHQWTRIAFNHVFSDPVIIANTFSDNDTDPGVVRLQNIDSNGFDIRVQEWDYLDGVHAEETVSYLVMERGKYYLTDGKTVVADRLESADTGGFASVDFNHGFREIPVVMTSVGSFNESNAVTTRIRNITENSFQVTLQEQQLNEKPHAVETIHYIAWEPSSGKIGEMNYIVNRTMNEVYNALFGIFFDPIFINVPGLIAGMQTFEGPDTANVRWRNKAPSGVEVSIWEEGSADYETSHAKEVVGYMVFSVPN